MATGQSMPNIPEVLDLIAARLTVEEILDTLGWSTFDLVHALQEHIEENLEEFEEACR